MAMTQSPSSQNMSSQRDPIRAFRIPDELYNELRATAEAADLNLSQAVRRAVSQWVVARSDR